MAEARPHVAVVGGTGGIGLAIARQLVSSSNVTIMGRRLSLFAGLEGEGFGCVELDVLQLDRIKPSLEAAVGQHGPLSALVYCAGKQEIRPLRMSQAADMAALVTVNLTAAMVCAGLFASNRVSLPSGVFCAISSTAAGRAEGGIVPYAATKAGLNALIRGMAREAAPRRAVAVAPGWIETDMTRSFPRLYTEEFKEKLAKATPLGLTPIEAVVQAVEFLLSPRAAHITGEVITVDGGASL